MYDDASLKQSAAAKRTLAAWKEAVAVQGEKLERALSSVPEDQREIATSPAVVQLIADLLRLRPHTALRWMLYALRVEALTPEWHTPPVAFLRVHLAAFADLLKEGHDPKALVRAARFQFADSRPFFRLPNVEAILEAYPAVRPKKPRRSIRQSSSGSA